jgi:hypothetical protein
VLGSLAHPPAGRPPRWRQDLVRRTASFHGSLIHGSNSDNTTDPFRLALIGHYIHAEAHQVGAYSSPRCAWSPPH